MAGGAVAGGLVDPVRRGALVVGGVVSALGGGGAEVGGVVGVTGASARPPADVAGVVLNVASAIRPRMVMMRAGTARRIYSSNRS